MTMEDLGKYKPYPAYKDSGIEWIGNVPEYWDISPLKWQIERNDGGVWGDDPDGENDTIVLRSTEQTVDGRWQIEDPAKRKINTTDKFSALLKNGDLLLTKSSGSSLHIGKTTLVTPEVSALNCCYSNFMQRIRTKHSFIPQLAWYMMNNDLARLQFGFLSNSTTGLANLNGSLIGQIVLPIAPLHEQQKIAIFLDRETAKQGLCWTWIKLTSIKKVRSASHTRTSAGGPLYQNVTIGGVGLDGHDATNALSFLILESVGEMKLTQPNLSIRYHSGTSAEFLAASIRVIEKGFGMPAFNNDEVVIPGMLRLGVSLEDARDYSAIGCIEVAVPGKWGYRTTGMSFLNFMRVFNLALQDGRDPETGMTFLAGTGKLADFADFGALMEAWKKQVQFYARATVAIDVAVDTALEELVPDVLCSVFTDDCIARGKHLKEGGAVYDWVSGLQVGVANLGNALAAVKKLVFEEGVIGRQELLDALANDFSGPQGEILRQRLLNGAPKFGNDNDEVDALVVEAYGYFADQIEKLHNTRWGRGPIGGGYYPGTSSISSNVPSGSEVGATADGRHAGTPLAEGCSPSSGTDLLGPTAVFKSIGKLPAGRIFGGVLLNQKLSPKSLETPNDKLKLEALIRTFFDDLGGWHVQYNIVSRETLIAAKKDPEKYRDLVVRVAGYSAFFRDLASDTQDDIIARTEHRL